MRVSRTQAAENREAVINAASRLFREHGFDGIGLKDLMKGAGLTQGAFYKQFASKDDLVAQASRRAMANVVTRMSATAAANPDDPIGAVIALYLSKGHREEKSECCPIVALGADAARQGINVKASFEAGIRDYLELLGGLVDNGDGDESRSKAMAILSTLVGAVILSRVVNDELLSEQFLRASDLASIRLPVGAAPMSISNVEMPFAARPEQALRTPPARTDSARRPARDVGSR